MANEAELHEAAGPLRAALDVGMLRQAMREHARVCAGMAACLHAGAIDAALAASPQEPSDALVQHEIEADRA